MIRELLFEIRTLIYTIRIQNYGKSLRWLSSLLSSFSQKYGDVLAQLVSVYGDKTVLTQLAELNNAMVGHDMVLAADLLEGVCLPALESLIVHEEPVKSDGYTIEPTASGWMTVKSDTSGGYLHSNNDPMWEAEQLARLIYDPKHESYCLWGLGLGYLPLRLYDYTDGTAPIRVYEEDREIIRLADVYGVVKELREKNIEIFPDPNGELFVKEIGQRETAGVFLHEPSIRKMKNASVRDALLGFLGEYESVMHFRQILERNYYKNRSLIREDAVALRDKMENRDIILVAAGPSLDSQIEYLKSVSGVKTILCVGTVLKKLLRAGICPDIVFFLDPNPVIMRQIEGVDTSRVPAVIASTAYWRIASEYKGKKYLAYQSSFSIKDDGEKSPVVLYNTGGSVSTLALDVALRHNASRIELVGLDLAYLDGFSHAEETHDRHLVKESDLIEVRGTSGKMVRTTEAMRKFRIWIEREIEKFPEIPVLNLSTTGALIKGTKRPE